MECEPFETQKLYVHNGHHLNLKTIEMKQFCLLCVKDKYTLRKVLILVIATLDGVDLNL